MIIVEIASFFQNEVAKVFSANNFNVLIFDDVRPTPSVVFFNQTFQC